MKYFFGLICLSLTINLSHGFHTPGNVYKPKTSFSPFYKSISNIASSRPSCVNKLYLNIDPENASSVQSQFQNVKESMGHVSPTFTLVGTYLAFMIFLNNASKFMQNGNNPFSILNDSPGIVTAVSNVTLDDVAGIDFVKTEVEEVISFITDKSQYEKVGAKIPRGVLLSSPPGCGKTLLARAIASTANVPLISVSGSEFIMVYVGLGAKRVRGLFEKARKMSPCIIFIDEIDALAGKRGSSNGNEEREATLNQLLTEMDGIERNENIVIIGATNRPDMLDPAVTRSGRMDRKIYMNLPRCKDRYEILKVHCKNKKLSPEVDLEQLAKQTPGMSGADMENIMNEASILSVRNNHDSIAESDVEEAFDKMTVGIRLPEIHIPEETNKIVCVHEAAHALVGHMQENYPRISRISAIPSSLGAGGFTLFTPTDNDETLHSKERLLAELRVLLGGRAGEEIVLKSGNITTGASNDLERARAIASDIISRFSMGDLIAYTSQDEELMIVNMLNTAYNQAMEIIAVNKKVLDHITEELLETREMSGNRFYEIVEAYDTSSTKTSFRY